MSDILLSEMPTEYANSLLLLSNKDRSGLFVSPENSANVLLHSDAKGSFFVAEISKVIRRRESMSLQDFGIRYLNLTNLSVNELLKLFVTPEMEVERIFNNLRFKYLQAIYMSNIENPQKYLKYTYNKAFQTLAGLTIYQGGSRSRKDNDAFWKEAGFTDEAKEQNWLKEHHEMQAIVSILKRVSAKPLNHLYAELIAIKPGFHELYLHNNYFDARSIPNGTSSRDEVFRMLRNKGDISSFTLDRLPAEINKNNYISYAPCNVTEGPFVFRKRLSVSYFSEIRRIRSHDQLPELHDNFHILDYYNHDLSTRDKLGSFLETARPFCHYLT